ncbi:MAG: ATPase domain-containing protein [Thermoplasmata archaeon]
MVSMGVKGFEILLPDGIGERMAVVLQGPTGDEKTLFAYQFLAEGLKANEGALIVLSGISPTEFRDEMRKHGVDCASHEKSGSLVIVDWYSYKKGRIDGVQIDGSVFRSSQSLLNLEIAITDATKRLASFPRKRAVLDVLSPALKMFGSDEAYTFAQKLRTRLRTENVASLLILEKGMHPDDVVQSIHQSFDGVIDFVKETKEDKVERKIGLLFIRGVSYEPTYTPYTLVDGEIVLTESDEETEGERILRMLKKQEELLAKNPTNERIWFSRGSLFADIGEFKRALECFDKVLDIDPGHAGAWSGRANALSHLGKPKDATKAYRNALLLIAEKIDKDYYEMLKSMEGRDEILGKERVEGKTRICPLCGAQALVTAARCPECGTDFKKLEEVPKEGILGYLESMGEDAGIKEEALDDLLRKKEVRERAAEAPTKTRAERGVGLTNGLARERVARGLVNGLGRVNGLVNGLANARSGLTNGLTNGSGFTNGLGSGRFLRETRRSKWKVYFVPLIAVVLLSTVFLVPEVPGPRVFGVDGYFDDWSDDVILYSRSTVANPNIDINATGIEMESSEHYVFLLTQVQPGGKILEGNVQQKLGDFFRVFIDSDDDDETGYAVAGTGADYLVQVVGRDGGQGPVARSKAVYRYVGEDHMDWNAWEFESPMLVALGTGDNANKIEVGISKTLLPNPERAVFVFQMEDWEGAMDLADYRMAGAKGILRVTQQSASREIIQTQASEPLLQLELKRVGYKHDTSGVLTLEAIRGMLLGTLPPSEVQSVSLVVADGSGGPWTVTLDGNREVAFQQIGYSFQSGAKTDFRVDITVRSSAPDGATVGFRIMSPDDIVISSGTATLESVATDHDLSYVGSVPAGHVIDGGFSDWTSVMSDGPNEPSTGGYRNLDIRRYDLNSTQDKAFFYLKVDGRMLEGTLTPQKGRYIPDYVPSRPDSDRDTIPDDEDDYPFDFDNDGKPDVQEGGDIDSDDSKDWPLGNDKWLETTVEGRDVRIYIGPRIPPPAVRGEDTVRIYLDSDKNPQTGYFVGSIGADYLVEIAGKSGQPLEDRRTLKEHMGSSGNWQWITVGDAEVALDLQNMEVLADIAGMGFLQDFPAFFETVGWLDRTDDAIGTRSLTRGDFEGYEAKYSGRYEAYVKGTAQSEEVVSISYEGKELSWGLPSSLSLVGPTARRVLSMLKATSLQLGGNEARFENPFTGIGSTASYAFEYGRVKESFIIRDPLELDTAEDSHVALNYAISFSEGLSPIDSQEFSDSSRIGFSDGQDTVFMIEPPFAIDSSGDRLDCSYSYNENLRSLEMHCPAPWFAGAKYPVTLDPTVVLETNALDEELGYNITTGDFNGDNAMDVAIGAPANDMNRDSNVGAVYIYYGGSSIDESYDFLINAPSNSVKFGAALASGDIDNDGYDDLIVGDPGYSSNEGRAYLYWGSSSFDGTADVTFSAPDSSGKFGFAIATGDLNAATDSYDDLVITAPAYNSNDGRAYVYFGNTSGNMDTSNEGVLNPSNSGDAGRFGHSVAIGQFNSSGTDKDVIISEPWYDIGTNNADGRTYIFIGGAGTSFDTTADNTSEPNTDFGEQKFGYSIAVSDYDDDGDDDVWIGAPYGDWPGFPMYTDCGFIYRVDAGGNDADPDYSGYQGISSNFLGISVTGGDLEGDGSEEAIVGARASTNDEGRVLIIWNPSGSNPTWLGANNGDRLGFALATGDVDNDGTYDDIIVGAPGYSSGDNDGAAFVYYGNTDGSFTTQVNLSLVSAANERHGFSLAKGDFNNDGYDDLAVGAPYYDSGSGRVYIYFGTSSGLSSHQPPDLMYKNVSGAELFGWNITAGDFNGDGYDDLLVGAPSNDNSSTNDGRAYIFFGGDGKDMDGDGVDVDIEAETDGEQFGWSVAAGNVDGSSNDDAIVGAPTYNTDKGRVYVYSAFTTPIETTPNATLARGASEKLGSSVAVMNYDEDSYEDVLVGAPLNDSDSNADKGVAFIYRGAQDMGSWFPIPGVGGNITTYTQHDPGDTCDNEDPQNLTDDDDVYYHILPGKTMWLYDFDTTGLSGLITGVMLYVQYNTDGGYSENEPMKAYLTGDGWKNTAIVPEQHTSDYDDSDDLYALGFDTWSEITSLHVRFTNPSGNKDVNFDYLALNITVHSGEEANITLKGQYAGDFTGLSVAAGDFDGDSSYADDAVLGAPGWYQATNDTGAVYVYSGTSIRGLGGDGTLSTPNKVIYGPGSTDAKFGWSIASFNGTGDSYDDLLVGAPYNGTSDNDGAVYAFTGPSSGFDEPDYTKNGEENELLGYDVVGGNFITSGSGYEEIAGGGPFFNGTDNDGRVLIENIPEFEEILIPLMIMMAIPIIVRRRLRR